MMTVSEVKHIAREWVLREAANIPGFNGAFYHGSVNWLPENDVFPATSDIDIIVVADGPPPQPGKFLYKNVIMEVSYLSMEQLGTAEQVSAQYYMAGSFRQPNIIADPGGRLTDIQQTVARSFTQRGMVEKRCRNAMERSVQYLDHLKEQDLLHDQVTSWLFGRGVMTHVLLVAGLQNPTVRQRYAAVQKLLAAYRRPDFHEILLQSLGCAQMSRARVEHHLSALTEAFDTARSVISTPYRFASDISDAGRVITIDGSRQLIAEGYHREAAFWIAAAYSRCQHVLYYDAPKPVQERLTARYKELLDDLQGWTYNDLQRSNEDAKKLLPQVMDVAAMIIRENKGITG